MPRPRPGGNPLWVSPTARPCLARVPEAIQCGCPQPTAHASPASRRHPNVGVPSRPPTPRPHFHVLRFPSSWASRIKPPNAGVPKVGVPNQPRRGKSTRRGEAMPRPHPRGTQKVGVPIQPRAARLHYPALTHIEQIAHANSLKRLTSWIQVRAFRHGYLRAGAINCRHKSNECSRQRQQER